MVGGAVSLDARHERTGLLRFGAPTGEGVTL
jgi:hypothetical protein